MPKKHKLGFNKGTILEYEDGTAAYRPSVIQGEVFRVKISEVTGFSVSSAGHFGKRLHLMGQGGEMAKMVFVGDTGEKVEKWFREQPAFGTQVAPAGAAQVAGPPATGVADELVKLVALRDSGALTQDEFEVQKAKLFGG
jgi:Short C-terminal domain